MRLYAANISSVTSLCSFYFGGTVYEQMHGRRNNWLFFIFFDLNAGVVRFCVTVFITDADSYNRAYLCDQYEVHSVYQYKCRGLVTVSLAGAFRVATGCAGAYVFAYYAKIQLRTSANGSDGCFRFVARIFCWFAVSLDLVFKCWQVRTRGIQAT